MVFPIENHKEFAHLRGDQQVLLCLCNCEEILAIRKLVLEAFGYEVLAADDIQGINTLTEQPVDVAILDYRARGTNGELIAIKTKILQPLTPIVLLVDDPASVPASVARLTSAIVKREYSPVGLLQEIARILHDDSGSGSRAFSVRPVA